MSNDDNQNIEFNELIDAIEFLDEEGEDGEELVEEVAVSDDDDDGIDLNDGDIANNEADVVMDSDESEDSSDGAASNKNRSLSLRAFIKHTKAVFWCDIHPSNLYVASGGEDNIAYLWNIENGQVVKECGNHADSVTHVAFSYDGAYLATGDMAGLVQVWKMIDVNVASVNWEPIWSAQIEELENLLWHSGSNVLLASQHTGEIMMWKIPSGQCKVMIGHGQGSECMRLSTDGKFLNVGYRDGCVKVWDLKAEKSISTYQYPVTASSGDVDDAISMDVGSPATLGGDSDEDRTAVDMDMLPGGQAFVVAYCDGTVMIASLTGSKVLSQFKIAGKYRKAEAVRCSKQFLFIGTESGIEIWDYGKMVMRSQIGCGFIYCMLYDAERDLLFAGGATGRLYVVSASTSHLIHYYIAHTGHILHIALANLRNRVVTSSEDGTCMLSNLEDIKHHV